MECYACGGRVARVVRNGVTMDKCTLCGAEEHVLPGRLQVLVDPLLDRLLPKKVGWLRRAWRRLWRG